MSEEYNYDLQKLYLEFLQADKELFVQCNAIPVSYTHLTLPTNREV